MNYRVNRSNVFTRAIAIGLLLLVIGIAYGKNHRLGPFSLQPDDAVQGTDTTERRLSPIPVETDFLPKKDGGNSKYAVIKDKSPERLVGNAPLLAKSVRFNSGSPASPPPVSTNPKQRPNYLRQLPLEWQVDTANNAKEFIARTKSPDGAAPNKSSKSPKPIFSQIPKIRKPTKRRFLMARYGPPAIFADGLPTPANPLDTEARNVAQTLNVNRVSKRLELYSKLLYGGVRLTRLDGKRFEADGEVFSGKGVPQGHFLLFRWFINCCSADAQPFGIIVRSSELGEVQEPFWVRVAGTLKFRQSEGKKIAYIDAETVKKIPIPPLDKRYLTY